jgi:membrane-associated phospholipid phosphatase
LIYVFGYYGILFGLIIPLVMWSRVYLKKHSTYQVLAGAAYGLLVTGLQFYLLIPV